MLRCVLGQSMGRMIFIQVKKFMALWTLVVETRRMIQLEECNKKFGRKAELQRHHQEVHLKQLGQSSEGRRMVGGKHLLS